MSSYYSMNRSLSERVKIKLEIYYENFLDFMAASALRKPLLIMVGVVAVMTMRNSSSSISTLKRSALSPFSSKWSSSNPFSPYGSTVSGNYGGSSYGGGSGSSYGGGGGSPYGGSNTISRTANSYGANTARTATSYGANTNAAIPSATSYGATTSSYGAAQTYGTNPSTPSYPQQQQQQYGSSSTLNSNLRGGGGQSSMQSSGGFSTTSLANQYMAQVQVAQVGLFQDYGMVTEFMGQIETVRAMDSPNFVQQTLNSPGNGKVLVVDGGGSFNGGLFDSNMAATAQRNGWKGIVINGVVLDAERLRNVQFGVKAMGVHPAPGQQMTGQRGIPLSFAGINFSPGAWIYADKAGIIMSQSSLNLGGSTAGVTNNFGGYASAQTNTYSSGQNSYPTGGVAGATGGSNYIQTPKAPSYAAPQTTGYGMQQPQQQQQQQTSYQTPGSNYGIQQPQGTATTGFAQPQRTTATGYTQPQRTASAGYGGATPTSAYQQGSYTRPTIKRKEGFFAKLRAKKNSRRPSSPYSSSSSFSSYGQKKKPSKKTLMGLLILVCVVAWAYLSD